MEFSEKLIKLRKIKGITQDEMASAVGVSRQAVYKWESGQSYPEVPKLIELHHLFAISIDDLLDDNYAVVIPETKKRRRKKVETAPVVQHESEEEVAINTSDEVINAVAAPAVKEEKIAEHIKTANVEPMKKPTRPAPKPATAPVTPKPAAPATPAAPKPATAPVTPKPATAPVTPKPAPAPVTPKPAAPTAPVKEEPVLRVPEAPKVEELPAEEPKEDKRGFFGRLFNRK